jgi:DNA repair exonuclease SbcCD ATPase subunit
MTTSSPEAKLSKREQLADILNSRQERLKEAKKELNKVTLELNRAQATWAKLSIDGAPAAGSAKTKLEKLRSQQQELSEKVSAYQVVYENSLTEPEILNLAEDAIEEAKAEIVSLSQKQDKAINELKAEREKIQAIGFKAFAIGDQIKAVETETRDLHKKIFGKTKILILPGSKGKLYARMPFFNELIAAWRKSGHKDQQIRPVSNDYVQATYLNL